MKSQAIINPKEIKTSVQGKRSNCVRSTVQLSKAQQPPEDPDRDLTTTVRHLNQREYKKTETSAGASRLPIKLVKKDKTTQAYCLVTQSESESRSVLSTLRTRILQAREWVAISFSRGSSQPRD